MTSQAIRQPLGSIQTLDKITSSLPPNLASEETKTLTIIYAKKKLQVDIPLTWTVNKLKCMLCTHFDILNFDRFEFQCNKMLIPGKTQVSQLPDTQLIVTKADCPNAFEKYYTKTIKKVVKKHNINTQSTLLPILHPELSAAMRVSVPKGRRKNIEQITEQRNPEREQQNGLIVMNVLRVIGIAFMGNIIFSFASYWQIGILVFIACLYYFIDEYVKQNERKRQKAQRQAQQRLQQENKRKQEQKKRNQKDKNIPNTQNHNTDTQAQLQQPFQKTNYFQLNKKLTGEKQINRKDSEHSQEENDLNPKTVQDKQAEEPQMAKIPQRKIFRAKLKLWMAFVIEAVYCYVLSIFPNWTVETHLHANQTLMDRVMNQVKLLDPEASETVKKWQIKNEDPSIQITIQEDNEEPKLDQVANE